ncbi:MAG: PQQ-dependent sugar dehydrogenase, partial [Planctomycetota bacterium JB042]
MTARTNTRGGEAGRAATTPPGLPFVPATVAAASALVLLALATVSACSRGPAPPPPPRLLVLGDAGAGEVPSGARRALAAVAGELGIGLEDADASALDEESLAACAAVVLLRAEPSFLESDADERALRRFVESGGGFVGLRAALEAAADRPWFTRLVGARRGEDGGLERRSPRVETSVADGAEAWRQSYDGGRSFVVDLGPDAAAWADPAERARLAEGVAWVVAGGPRRADRVLPDDETFEVETLVDGLEDPIELAVDEGGNVFVLERTGALKRYDAGDRRIETVRRFEVASKTEEGGHAQECGGLGLALDPAFARNGFVYVYRSPPEPSVNRLSRFTFDGERLVDERVLLDVATDREHTTCHEGGSLAFGPDGCLFLSTGDNTNPFESDGFAPLDEREDRRWWDAQRSAGNSNDLRGSILRVRPLPDGTLAIPDGNLWPPGTERTRPEIYVKGCRNPYRIAVDPRTGAVWWGDVGPDADVDAGGNPMGADELNRAERAGFHGWPYAIGRRAYGDRSFRTGASGASFAEGIVNDSPHSDGLAALPAPVAPFLAYPYREADDLPELGDGGRNAMAGPILHHDEGKVGGFPPWFDRVMVFYDWSRAGLWLLKIDDRGRLETLLPWLVDETWKHPIDLERGPDGALYLLEYGSTWWDNRDGRLRRISFGGFDRRPRAVVTPSATDGAVPLSILFDATSTVDPEAAERHGDPTRGVRFRWAFGDGATSSESAPTHVYRRAGAYDVELVVTDAAGRTDVWSGRVVAGNTAPAVAVSTSAEEGVFAWGSAIDVAVDVHDPDE